MNRTIISIICFIVALGLGIGVVWPKYQDYKVLKLGVEKKKIELSYHQQYFAELKEIDSKLSKYEVALSKIDYALPADFSLPAFFANLQRIASQSGMILNQIGEGPIQKTGAIQERSFSLSLSGSFSNFKNFLSALEKSAKLIEVENFSFTSLKSAEESISFTVSIKTYSY